MAFKNLTGKGQDTHHDKIVKNKNYVAHQLMALSCSNRIHLNLQDRGFIVLLVRF